MRIALVAGEASGDTLGAALIEALKRRFPDAEFAGVAGPRMKAAGCVAWHGIEELSVMGLTEVISHLPKLLAIARRARAPAHAGMASGRLHRRRLQGIQSGSRAQAQSAGPGDRAVREPADLGVAPGARAHDERSGRPRAVPVSVRAAFLPRARRARGVRRASARGPDPDRSGQARRPARNSASTRPRASSRCCPAAAAARSSRLGAPFAATAEKLARQFPGLVCIAPMVTPALRDSFARHCAALAPTAKMRLLDGDARSGAGRGRRRAGRLRHGDARGRAAQASDGGRVPVERADRVAAAHVQAREGGSLLPAEPARGREAGRRVLPGRGESGRDVARARRLAVRIPSAWNTCVASSRSCTNACAAMAPNAPRPKSRSCSPRRTATP